MITKLYDSFQPTNYKLSLDINSEELVFIGSVKIMGVKRVRGNTVTLHAKDLAIKSATINGKIAACSTGDSDTLILESDAELPTSELAIDLEFSGTITEAMHGMYPCYFEHNGIKKKLIATQFESHHAREVFPCIDEPAAKATFDVALTTEANETVLSNMPSLRQETKNKRQTTTFETTPVMSTYLLAFVAGEMVYKEGRTKDGVIVRNWASVAQDSSWLEYSVKETVDLIELYNEYFGVPYPLAKCDQVALPDFEAGAMENWGLITYRETVLLSDPTNPSLSTQQLITLVIAHELSHQWFGNLVTMQWWDDLWLNESFANMTEYLATDKLHPEWSIWEEFIASDAISATNRDVYSDVQAVRVEVLSPEEIHTLFDPSIVYAKGGKLLKMLHDLLGDEAWRRGLKHYFETHSYKNTTRDDLWHSLSHVSDIDVPALMDTWIECAGQPLVSVEQKDSEVTLSQKRLLLDGSDDTVWHIPLLSKDLPLLLQKQTETMSVDASDFVTLDESGVGHYITNYTQNEHKEYIAKQLSDTNTSSEWKITYLNGLVMLCKYGATNLSEPLQAVYKSSDEPRATVWSQISSVLGSSRLVIEGDEELEQIIKNLSLTLSQPQLKKLGWEYNENEASNDIHLRTTLIGLAISSENQDILNKALSLYRSESNVEKLPAELRSMLLGVAVRFGDESEFEKLINVYKSTSNADLKSDITAALCSTKDPQRAKQLLTLVLDTTTIRTQDTIRWYAYLLRNRYTRSTAWDWLSHNWAWVIENFGGSKSYDDFARYSAAFFGTEEYLEKYTEFFGPMSSDPALKRAIAIGIKEITARVEWRARDGKPVTEWLKKFQSENL